MGGILEGRGGWDLITEIFSNGLCKPGNLFKLSDNLQEHFIEQLNKIS